MVWPDCLHIHWWYDLIVYIYTGGITWLFTYRPVVSLDCLHIHWWYDLIVYIYTGDMTWLFTYTLVVWHDCLHIHQWYDLIVNIYTGGMTWLFTYTSVVWPDCLHIHRWYDPIVYYYMFVCFIVFSDKTWKRIKMLLLLLVHSNDKIRQFIIPLSIAGLIIYILCVPTLWD